ncbi:uncharacterized protein F4817DRAFT_351547 [Daldinia loculata]|uniref:uncharacterized protein n=1 Tax=Daldinia loculata TaxID=103429 RepID=UPI0020C2E79E|nr:uncharacterized protein F4817DRAFT_351547 [Daldinia loculata]KAI1642937.1 hypothetical protein F4817DRAFT_351547 [Daldinia loculata]
MCMKANCSTCRKLQRVYKYLVTHQIYTISDIYLTCLSLDKTTWVGCGSHISSVLDNIPPQDWCVCEPKVEVNDKKYPPGAKF